MRGWHSTSSNRFCRRSAALAVVGATLLVGGCYGGPSIPPPPPPPASTTSTALPPPPKPAVLDAACRGTLVASTPGTVASSAVVELSGIAASRHTAGVWWANNDSGDTARVFAISDDGRDLGDYTLAGASATDWEDIAAGPGPSTGVDYLYAADTGDNAHARASIRVYRVAEPVVDPSAPTPAPQTLNDVDILTFVYPDAPHDAEAFFVDPSSREMFIVTKETSGVAKVFRAPADLVTDSTTTLTEVATLTLDAGFGGLVTAADVTPAGDVVGVRTYTKVLLFPRAAGTPLASAFSKPACAGKTAPEPQGEAIGFTRDGRGYTTASEGGNPALHRFVAP